MFVDRDVRAADHPDRLAGAGAVAHVRLTGRGFQDQLVGAPDRAVDILARVDAHDVAVPGHRSGVARRVQAALRADQEHLGADAGRAGRGPAEPEEQRAPPAGPARAEPPTSAAGARSARLLASPMTADQACASLAPEVTARRSSSIRLSSIVRGRSILLTSERARQPR